MYFCPTATTSELLNNLQSSPLSRQLTNFLTLPRSATMSEQSIAPAASSSALPSTGDREKDGMTNGGENGQNDQCASIEKPSPRKMHGFKVRTHTRTPVHQYCKKNKLGFYCNLCDSEKLTLTPQLLSRSGFSPSWASSPPYSSTLLTPPSSPPSNLPSLRTLAGSTWSLGWPPLSR